MAEQTLDELKKENAAAEAKAAKQGEKADEEQGEQGDVDADDAGGQPPLDGDSQASDEDDQPGDSGQEEVDEGAEVVDNDAWLKPEDDEPQGERVSDHDAAAIRKKWKGQARAREAENAELRKKLEDLEKKVSTPVQQPAKPKPAREAFKTDAEFTQALVAYEFEVGAQRQQTEQAAQQIQARRAEQKAKIDKDVDGHYLRAKTLAEKSKISPETYQSADKAFRDTIESCFPNAGDAVADGLISSLGPGSEKVAYNIGISPARQAKLVQLFKDDPSGIRAATYLGELKQSLTAPVKRESNAPAPPDKIQGDKAGGKGGAEKMRKDYQAAHSKGDTQKAFDIKRAAKARGLSVKGW